MVYVRHKLEHPHHVKVRLGGLIQLGGLRNDITSSVDDVEEESQFKSLIAAGTNL